MKWTIDKSFSFCYGHRVWTQKLEGEFCESGDTSCKCRHLHGHEGLVHVFLESDKLERGMVTDFKHLGWLKNFLDTYLDHKFIIDQSDPMFESMVISQFDSLCDQFESFILFPQSYDTIAKFMLNHTTPIYVPETNTIVGYSVSLDFAAKFANTPVYEVLQGFTIVSFVPTSENLSWWLYDAVQAKMDRLGIKVSRVDWFETPKSRSSYS